MSEATVKSNSAERFLGTEKISRLLVKFSVPCVLSMLVSALYNIVDQVFIGRGVGYLGNAATTVVYPFTVIALAFALLIGDGSAALFSLSLGRGEKETAHKSIGNSLILLLIAAVLLTGAGFVFEDQLLTLFGVTEGAYQYAREYMTVICAGIPFYMVTSTLNGIIRADGSPAYAMVATVVGALINLILDPVAIFVLDMGVKGAAWATILGQIVTGILSVVYLFRTKLFRLSKASFKPEKGICVQILRLGLTSLIIQISIVIVMSVANNLIGKYGPLSVYGADIPLSAIGIVMKVFAIVIAFAVGVSVGGQPIVGYNYGAKNYDRVRETHRLITIINCLIGIVSMLLFECAPQAIINIFGNENELYNTYSRLCFRIFLSGILLCCIQKSGSIFLQSIGKPVQSTILSMSRDVIFFVPALLLITPRFGVVGMLWAAPVADVLAGGLTVFLIVREFRNMQVNV